MADDPRRWRVLVTGGSGFIGTNLVEAYRTTAAAVMSVDVMPPRHPNHRSLWVRTDLLDPADVTATVANFAPTHVLHLGARTDLRGSTPADYRLNTDGVENLIAAVNESGTVRRVVHASSRLVCEIGYRPQDELDVAPTTAYGSSKVEGEHIVRASTRVPWTIVRPTSIWGPWFGAPYLGFFRAVSQGRYLHPRGLRIMKSFGFVGNTVAQLHRLLLAPADEVHQRTLYLGDYPPLEVHAWAQTIARLSGTAVREVPLAMLRVAATAGDLARRVGMAEPPLTSFRLNNLVTEMVYDMTPLEEIAGALPYSEEQGVAETLAWMREHGEIPE